MSAWERSKVERMTLRQTRAWLERYFAARGDEPCEHGHFGCSTEERGPCMDEALTNIEAAIARRDPDMEGRP